MQSLDNSCSLGAAAHRARPLCVCGCVCFFCHDRDLVTGHRPRSTHTHVTGSTRGWRQTCHFTKTQVKRSLHSRHRSSLRPTRDPSTRSVDDKRRVARVRRSPTPAALQVAMTAHSAPATHHTEAARRALLALLLLQPAAPERRGWCPAASSSCPPTRLDDAGSCGTRLARKKSDDTACMASHGKGGGKGWQPHDNGCEGCRDA